MNERRAFGADARRDLVLELYARACAAVDGRRAVRAALATRAPSPPLSLIAVGKAASAMAHGAIDARGSAIRQGLVIGPRGPTDAELAKRAGFRCLAGDHPVPGAGSLAAGAALLEFAAAIPPASPVLVLVSGGASSLVESLPDGIGAADLARVNAWGIGSGLPIEALNAIRRRLSRLKDGRLAAALGHTVAEALLVSDVPADDPAVIGSGLVACAGPAPLPDGLPDWLTTLLAAAGPLPAGATLPARVVATLGDALDALERAADERGLVARRLLPPAAGDVHVAASRFAHELALSTADVLVWGGETTVVLPQDPGRGGRNQHFALLAARLIAGHPDLVVLAAGTDGGDGNTTDAGAIVDGGTIARGTAAAHDADAAIERADAGRFLEASGDLLHTGPTGTNVGDLMIGLRRPPQAPDGGAAAHPGAG